MNIKNSIAVVTGGASGLGEACVRSLLSGGAKIAILDFAADRGEKIAVELGKDVIFAQTDVADDAGVQGAINKTMEAFGAINIVINCAGGAVPMKVLSKKGPMPLAAFNRTIQINLVGTRLMKMEKKASSSILLPLQLLTVKSVKRITVLPKEELWP